MGSNGEIGIRSIDAKITQTTNPIVNMTKTIRLWLMLSIPTADCTTVVILLGNRRWPCGLGVNR